MKPCLFLYIHIPFCRQKCSYCDFATLPFGQSVCPDEYVACLQKEILYHGQSLKNRLLKTVYFGGGTPSLLSVRLLSQIMEALHRSFCLDQNTEITIEVNPGTLYPEKLKGYLQLGVNRFSLGVQTFNEPLLKLCRREHGVKETRAELELFSSRGLNFSCDLLFALPRQNLFLVQNDLKEILKYSPPHISSYELNVPKSHVFAQSAPSEALQIQMMEWIETTLAEHGYFQYEISNFCKKSFESRHNQAYWTDQEFWGLGISSHSYLKDFDFGVRFWNPKNFKLYKAQMKTPPLDAKTPYSRLPEQQVEQLTFNSAFYDFCHTALRTKEGLSCLKTKIKFGREALKLVQSCLNPWVKKGFVEQNDKKWFLNEEGRRLSNQIFSSLFFH